MAATAATVAPTSTLYMQNNSPSAVYTSRVSNPTSPTLSDPNYPYVNRVGCNQGPAMAQTPPSANVSPTEQATYQTHQHIAPPRQLRQPRQPLYTPAALRPTDHKHHARPTDIPPRPRAPDTPPASKENSFDSGHSKHRRKSPPTLELPGASSSAESFPSSLSSSDTLISPSAPRRSLTSPAQSFSHALPLPTSRSSSAVTGPPTTAHWKPDVSATGCNICQQPFHWYLRRRHHCRRCGHVVCAADSAYQVPLDQHARFHVRGAQSRACNGCWDEWRTLNVRRADVSQSAGEQEEEDEYDDEEDDSEDEDGVPSRRRGNGKALSIPTGSPNKTRDMRVGSLARSEGGMVWSTF